jgi:hypothetical protein
MPDACLPVIRAALEDAHLLHEDDCDAARRVAQYLISSGYQIAPAAVTEGASQ